MAGAIPEFCDFDCPHAGFPPEDTAGICRTMSAVWCRKLRELTNKNMPCEWRRRGGVMKRAASKGTARGGRRRRGKA